MLVSVGGIKNFLFVKQPLDRFRCVLPCRQVPGCGISSRRVFRHARLVAVVDLAAVLRALRLSARLDIDESMWLVLHAACYTILLLFCS